MRASFKIILAGVSMVAVCAVVWRASSRSDDARPNATVRPASEAREPTPAVDVSEAVSEPDGARGGEAPVTAQDRLNLEDPKRPRSAPTLRLRKLEQSLQTFQKAEASQRYRTAGQVLTEAIAVIMDSEGRWEPAEPAEPAAAADSDGKSEPEAGPAEGESILTVDGRTYTISLAEFPEFDECTAPERKRLQGEARSSPPVMTEALTASVKARVQQALGLLQHFERNK